MECENETGAELLRLTRGDISLITFDQLPAAYALLYVVISTIQLYFSYRSDAQVHSYLMCQGQFTGISMILKKLGTKH